MTREIKEFQEFCVAVYTKIQDDVQIDGVYFGASVCRIDCNGETVEIKRDDVTTKTVDDMARELLGRVGIIKTAVAEVVIDDGRQRY